MTRRVNAFTATRSILALLILIVCCFVLAAGGLGGVIPELDVFVHFAYHAAALAVVSVAALLWRRRGLAILLGGFGMVLAAPHALSNILIGNDVQVSKIAPAAAFDAELKIMFHNVYAGNERQDVLASALRQSDADVVVLLETSHYFFPVLDSLRDTFPYQARCDRSRWGSTCEASILSRKPWESAKAGNLESVSTVYARFRQGNRVTTVMGVHLFLPVGYSWRIGPFRIAVPSKSRQPEQFDEIAAFAREEAAQGNAVIIGGDWNATPWSHLVARFQRASGLNRAGAWFPTWPAWPVYLAQFPIDQVFVSRDVDAVSISRGNAANSDHYPVLGVFRLRRS